MAADFRRFLVADFAISFMWVCSNELVKIFVNTLVASQLEAHLLRSALSLLNTVVFAYVSNATNGSSYNPLTVLAFAISGDFSNFLLTVGARIPVQVVGSVYGVRMILSTFPGRHDPHLKVEISKGALTEGLLSFAIVMITLVSYRDIGGDFLIKTWMTSFSKMSLHFLGSDLTGGFMNPAYAMGWAFATKQHVTKEHLIVYWLAPVEATLVAVWLFGILFGTKKEKHPNAKKPARKFEKTD